MDKELTDRLYPELKGEKGGGGGGSSGGTTVVQQTVVYQAPPPRTPVEAANSLQSSAVARILDLLCEGEIEGPANNDDWEQSTYFNEVPFKSSTGTYNFQGVTLTNRVGTVDQTHIPGFDKVETGHSVNVQLTVAGGAVTRSVTNSDVNSVLVTIVVPTLLSQNITNGDVNTTSVQVRISVTPDGGSPVVVKTETISGKCVAPYERQVRIDNIGQYGNAPWTITLLRITADSSTTRLQNATHWKSYTEVVDENLIYPDSALMGVELDAKQFGSQIPSRAYYGKWKKVSVPDNRYYDEDTDTATYSGAWSGTFKTEWTDNPVWCFYDVATNDRYGLGLDASLVDKFGFYTISAYNDTQVPWTKRTAQSDGTYATTSGTERRFTFNHPFSAQADAINVLSHIASSMRAFPLWVNGQLTLVQDSPTDVSKVLTNANVEGGVFNYEGTARRKRTNTVHVSWNDPNDFGKRTIEVVENKTGISNYGVQLQEITAIGCISQSLARRIGKWALDTDLNATETVTFRGGMDVVDLFPGDVFSVADGFYASEKRGGRVVVASGTSITIETEKAIDIDFGETYTLLVQTTNSGVLTRELTNSVGDDQTVLTFTDPLVPPTDEGLVWVVTSTDLAHRTFRCINNREVDKSSHEITGVLYDSTKYARVEQGISVELPVTTRVAEGVLTAPTSLTAYEYPYVVGDPPTYKFGLLIGFIASTDPRTQIYEGRIFDQSTVSGTWEAIGVTTTTTLDYKPVASGTYTIQIRGKGVGATSEWVSLPDFAVYNLFLPYPPTNLRTAQGGSTFTDYDPKILWDASIGSQHTSISGVTISGVTTYTTTDVSDSIKDYKVNIRRTSDNALLRTEYTTEQEYIYLYEKNKADHSGTANSTFEVEIFSRDKLNRESATSLDDSISASTPTAPSNVQVVGGGTSFSGSDCDIEWDDSTEGKHKDYRVGVYKTDDTLLRTVHVTDNNYTYTLDENLTDTQDVPISQIKFQVADHDFYTLYSANTTLTASGVTVPDVTGLTVLGGSTTTFSGADCEIVWNDTVHAGLKDYRVVVTEIDDTVLRTEYVRDNRYVYTQMKNWEDHATTSGIPVRAFEFKVRARNNFGRVSENDAVLSVNNPAPDMSGTSPTVTALFQGLKIDWSNIVPTDNDGKSIKVYADTSNPPTTEIVEVSWYSTSWIETGLDTDTPHFVQLEPYDWFGPGSKTTIPASVTPLKVGAIDIDAELTQSIVITDNYGTASGTLTELYDRNKTSDGPSYTTSSSGVWINYDFGIENFIDRVSVWTDVPVDVYVAYKRFEESLSFLKAEADHTLDANGELLAATNEADAQTNYWTTSSGRNVAVFPQRIIADECRLYIWDGTVQIHELVFMREVIAEQVTADNLSSISADVGVVTAGILQSADGRFLVDLDEGFLKIFDDTATLRLHIGKLT